MTSRIKVVALGLAALAAVACGDDKKDGGKAPAGGGKAAAAPKEGGAAATGEKYDAAKGTATLKGVVKYKGTAPPQKVVNKSGTPECAACGDSPLENIEVNADGTLPHVFVYAVEGPAVGLSGYATGTVEVDQKGCVYEPHVVGLVTGGDVLFKNTDKLSHNVHVKGRKPGNDKNLSQSAGHEDKFQPAREFGIKVICDVHTWMSSYMHVIDHPFFATSARGNGAFEIKGLYPGKYKFKAWHENWAKEKQVEFEMDVPAGGATHDIEIEIK